SPQMSLSPRATTRPTRSTEPPGVYGLTMRTERVGKSRWANAGRLKLKSTARAMHAGDCNLAMILRIVDVSMLLLPARGATGLDHEFLHALATEVLGDIQVAFGIGRDIVR